VSIDLSIVIPIYNEDETIPILVKRLIKRLPRNGKETAPNKVSISVQASIATGKRPSQRVKDEPVQMTLIG